MQITMLDLEMALEFCSTDYAYECDVFLDRSTGQFYYASTESEDETPADIDDEDKYIQIPTKYELGLGKPLAIQFSSEQIPAELDNVYQIFSRKGAFQRYKALLDGIGRLEDWFQYEKEHQKQALLEWCEINDIKVEDSQ